MGRLPRLLVPRLGVVMLVEACGGQARPLKSPPPPVASAAEAKPRVDPALEAQLQRATWLFPATDCPADVAAPTEQLTTYLAAACNPNLQACLDRCQKMEANACYAAALRLQQLKVDERYSEACFLRACRLGSRSGCTNRAAGIMMFEGDREGALTCAARTFELMCRSNDPWACSMLGMSLANGLGVTQDLRRALEVLPKGCLLSTDDPACVAAQRLIKEVEAALANGSQ